MGGRVCLADPVPVVLPQFSVAVTPLCPYCIRLRRGLYVTQKEPYSLKFILLVDMDKTISFLKHFHFDLSCGF